jgi:hypothetical protein
MTTPLHAAHKNLVDVDDLVVSGDTTLAGTLGVTGAATFAYNYRDSTTFGDIQLEAYNKYSPSTTIDSHRIKLMEAQTFGGYMSFSGIDSGSHGNHLELGYITGGNSLEYPFIRMNIGDADTIEMFKPLAVTGNATVGGTLNVTNAATLGGGEVVTIKNVVFNGAESTQATTGTQTVKKMLFQGTLPSSGEFFKITSSKTGLTSANRVIASHLMAYSGTNSWYHFSAPSYLSFISSGTTAGEIQHTFPGFYGGNAFKLYVEYY